MKSKLKHLLSIFILLAFILILCPANKIHAEESDWTEVTSGAVGEVYQKTIDYFVYLYVADGAKYMSGNNTIIGPTVAVCGFKDIDGTSEGKDLVIPDTVNYNGTDVKVEYIANGNCHYISGKYPSTISISKNIKSIYDNSAINFAYNGYKINGSENKTVDNGYEYYTVKDNVLYKYNHVELKIVSIPINTPTNFIIPYNCADTIENFEFPKSYSSLITVSYPDTTYTNLATKLGKWEGVKEFKIYSGDTDSHFTEHHSEYHINDMGALCYGDNIFCIPRNKAYSNFIVDLSKEYRLYSYLFAYNRPSKVTIKPYKEIPICLRQHTFTSNIPIGIDDTGNNPAGTTKDYSNTKYGSIRTSTIKDICNKISGETDFKPVIDYASYIYTFDANGGEVSPVTKTIKCGPDKLNSDTMPTPIRDGYIFNGWYLEDGTQVYDKNFSDREDNIYYEDTTFIAHWTPETYYINYTLNGGDNSAYNPTKFTTDDTVTLTGATRIGYTFDGWYETSDFSGDKITTINGSRKSSITLYAKWLCNHRATESANNGTDSTCTVKGHESDIICSECGEIVVPGAEKPLLEHSYNEGTITLQPTCTEKGIKTYTCKDCGATKIEDIDALGHDYSGSYVVDKAVTCTEDGLESRHCSKCDSTTDARVIKSTGHVWDDGDITKEATETEDGEILYHCTKCNATKKNTIPAYGVPHECDFTGDWHKDNNYHWKECSCGKVSEKATHTWDEGKIKVKATTTTTGIMLYTCTFCSQTKEEIIPKLTIQEEKCSHENKVTKNEKDATCIEEGYTGDIYCDDCGILLEEGTIVPKKEHTWNEGDTIKAPTTTEEGYIKYICKLCSKEKFVKIPKLPSSTTEEQNSNNNDDNNNNNNNNNNENNNITDNNKPQTEITNESIISAKKVKASISSVKKNGKKIVIKLKKKSGYKYEIKISTDKKFKKLVKTYKTSKTTYKIRNVKKGKTYYVKARSYKNINGSKVYGKWSKVKKIKIK